MHFIRLLMAGVLVATASAQPAICVVPTEDFFSTVRSAHTGVITAFSISPTLYSTLLDACRGGAHDVLILDQPSYLPKVLDNNNRAIEAINNLRGNCSARPVPDGTNSHLKLVYLDRTAYLSDTNFGSHSTIFRVDDPQIRSLLAQTLQGSPSSLHFFTTVKGDALTLEEQVLGISPGPLDVATESFGPGRVFDALSRAGEGRLLVGSSEARDLMPLLARLPERVAIRADDDNIKTAVNRKGGWCYVGSANATEAVLDQVEWGYATSGAFCQQLENRFNAVWAMAQPLR